jgi:Glycine cleavage H-protein
MGAVESVKAASDIVEFFFFFCWFPLLKFACFFFLIVQFAPVSGTIEEINEELNSEPGLLNKSAEEAGELFVLCFCFVFLANGGKKADWLRIVGWLCKIKLSEPSEVKMSHVAACRVVCAHTLFFFLLFLIQMNDLMAANAYKEHCEK